MPWRRKQYTYYLEREDNDPLLRTCYLERVQCMWIFFITYRKKETLQQDPVHMHTQLKLFTEHLPLLCGAYWYFYSNLFYAFSSISLKNAGHDPLNWSHVSLMGLRPSLQWWEVWVLDSECSLAPPLNWGCDIGPIIHHR